MGGRERLETEKYKSSAWVQSKQHGCTVQAKERANKPKPFSPSSSPRRDGSRAHAREREKNRSARLALAAVDERRRPRRCCVVQPGAPDDAGHGGHWARQIEAQGGGRRRVDGAECGGGLHFPRRRRSPRFSYLLSSPNLLAVFLLFFILKFCIFFFLRGIFGWAFFRSG